MPKRASSSSASTTRSTISSQPSANCAARSVPSRLASRKPTRALQQPTTRSGASHTTTTQTPSQTPDTQDSTSLHHNMARAPTDIRSMARAHTKTALNTLTTIAARGTSESARVAAAQALLDRGYGKAATILAGDEEGGPVVVNIVHRCRE